MTHTTILSGRRQRRLVGVLADQVSWSGAFFIFTATVGLGAPTDFAPVAIATSFSLIVLAVTRTWTIDSALLFAPGHDRSALTTLFIFFVAGAIASGAYSTWSLVFSTSMHWEASFLAFALVFGDNARYTWMTHGRTERSLPLSATYITASLIALAASRLGLTLDLVTVGWAVLLSLLGFAGFRDSPEKSSTVQNLRRVRGRRIALTFEALYFMAASQVGLLALSVLADAEDVAGLRFAYAVALAPAALLIQALATQVLRWQGRRQGTRRGTQLGQRWGWFCVCIYAINSAFALGALHIWNIPSLALAAPFIPPLCALLSAQAVSNALHTVLRYHVSVTISQGLKICTLIMEVAFQVGGVLLAGTDGLIMALYAGATARLLLWISMSWWLHRRSHTPNE